jgi:hypothetical protein
VVIAFDSAEKAREWYDSPAYEAIKPIRQSSAQSRICIVEGVALNKRQLEAEFLFGPSSRHSAKRGEPTGGISNFPEADWTGIAYGCAVLRMLRRQPITLGNSVPRGCTPAGNNCETDLAMVRSPAGTGRASLKQKNTVST